MAKFSRKLSFVDDKNQKIKVELEITNRNGYPEFTCSGSAAGHHGQMYDSIVPKNENQQIILDIWKKYHLNGMTAGTEAQINILKKCGSKEFQEQCDFLMGYNIKGKALSYQEVNDILKKTMFLQKRVNNLSKKIVDFEGFEKEWKSTTGNDWVKSKYEEIVESLSKEKSGLGGSNFVYNKKEFHHVDCRYYKSSPYCKLPNAYFASKGELTEEYSKLQKELYSLKKSTALHDINPNTKELFKYGSAWIKSELPEDFEDTLNELCDSIEEEEKEEMLSKTKIVDYSKGEVDADLLNEFYDVIDDEILALGYILDLTLEDLDDIEHLDYGWGKCLYKAQGEEYYIGTKKEMTSACEEYIKETVWAFRSSFLAEQTDIPEEVFTLMQDKCEGANDGILAIINKTCGLDEFCSAAISEDSIGQFLNSYDSTDQEFEYNGETYVYCQS